jgi:hypothetical protein
MLDSPACFLETNDEYLLAVTSSGTVYVWYA